MRSLAVAALIALIPLAAASQTGMASAPLTPAPASGLSRTITLRELGYRDGLTLRALGQTQTLYFPVRAPDAVTGLSLILPYATASALPARRSLEAWVGGRPVATVALPNEMTAGALSIPVGLADVRNGFLAVTLRYAGVSTKDRCLDERTGGDFVTLSAQDGLRLSLNPAALTTVRSVAAFAPPNLRLVLPSRPATAGEIAAALTLAAGAPGVIGFGPNPSDGAEWTETTVMIGQGEAAAAVTAAAGKPGLALGGANPAGGAKLLNSAWTALMRTPATAGTVTAPGLRQERVTLRRLGVDPAARDLVGRVDWPVAFSLKQLPPGREPAGIDVQVIAPPDHAGGVVVTASLNGQVIANARASRSGPTSLTAGLPEGLATLDNNLVVSVIRQPTGGDCKLAPQGYPAQLVSSSALTLRPVPDRASDFNGLAARFANGLTVRLPSAEAESLEASLPLAALAVQRLAPPGAPIKVVFGEAALEGPFIAIGPQPPAGAKPPVRFDIGAVTLTTAEGRQLFKLGELGALTTAQVVSSGPNQGLWLRPGPQAELPASLEIDRGDVAFLDRQGVTLAFSTSRDDLIDIRYPDRPGVLGWISQHRVWIVLGVWILITLGFLIFLQRTYRAKRRKGGA